LTVCAALTALVLPATSVCVAVKVQILLAANAVWPPAVLPVSMLHAPLALAVVVKVCGLVPSVDLAVKVTVALASAPVPRTVGAVLLLAATGALTTGAAALVSIVRLSALEVTFAVTSLAVMLRTTPAALPDKEVGGVKVHTPVLASDVVVPSKVAPSYTCTEPPLVTATPVKVGTVLRVMPSPAMPLSPLLTKAGKPMRVLSTVKV